MTFGVTTDDRDLPFRRLLCKQGLKFVITTSSNLLHTRFARIHWDVYELAIMYLVTYICLNLPRARVFSFI
jgi:hypothetical protein